MRNFKRIAAAFLCVLLASFTVTGCSKTSSQEEAEAQTNIRNANIASIQNYTEQRFANVMVNNTYEVYDQQVIQAGQTYITMTFDNDLAERWKTFVDKHGEVRQADVDETLRTDDGNYTSRILLTGEDGKQMALTITYSKSAVPVSAAIADYSDDSKETIGTKLSRAGVHTLIGLCTVFSILVILCLIIGAMKYVNAGAPKKKPAAQNAQKAAPAAITSAVSAAAPEELNLQENAELAAVIAAAIAASEEKPAEGFVVRSIKRINSNKWRQA